jgi:hypothetical protein
MKDAGGNDKCNGCAKTQENPAFLKELAHFRGIKARRTSPIAFNGSGVSPRPDLAFPLKTSVSPRHGRSRRGAISKEPVPIISGDCSKYKQCPQY